MFSLWGNGLGNQTVVRAYVEASTTGDSDAMSVRDRLT